MMWSEFDFVVDSKNRVFIPAKYREALGASFMIYVDFRYNCLVIKSNEDYENDTKQIKAMLDAEEYSKVLRKRGKFTIQAIPDSQGRVLLSALQLKYCDILKEVKIVGCGDYAEIWPAEKYESADESFSADDYLAVVKKIGF